MKQKTWLNLQLFAGEGAGDGGGEGAATGENAVDAGQQRLLELGVPADKIRKRAYKAAPKPERSAEAAAEPVEEQVQEQAAAAEDTHAEEAKPPARMSWEEIMADPEYNKQMQSVVQSRLKAAKASEEKLEKLTPALEVLARKYGLDTGELDVEALAKSIDEDGDFYEEKALEMGVPVETAMKLDRMERDADRRRREDARALEDKKLRAHYESLERQAKELRKVFPQMDLQKELQNPTFMRMTAPNGGVSVEDAYYAVHRKEIQAASMQATAQKTAEKLSNAIQAGQYRPAENGTSGQAASVTAFDYRNASREQRDALKRQIREAAARGQKLYPGQ